MQLPGCCIHPIPSIQFWFFFFFNHPSRAAPRTLLPQSRKRSYRLGEASESRLPILANTGRLGSLSFFSETGG
ncbi:hypothetical protein B0T19DRAFT_431116 [Cercophora scortea]|uniref:Uncharacterized protein n=1 Tax=Cercophora scortea TaxID=314031 RepID=A0AAE0IA96_9PEZI|nr:hypothetical protein B0T19DRAFT_431116 [Cercophora scortea]